jgi:hypothetical protein
MGYINIPKLHRIPLIVARRRSIAINGIYRFHKIKAFPTQEGSAYILIITSIHIENHLYLAFTCQIPPLKDSFNLIT